jgi:hypothetical protein
MVPLWKGIWQQYTPKSILRSVYKNQGCGSGSGFRDFVDPDPYWESGYGSRGKKTKKFQWENALFSYLKKNLPLKSYKIALTTF